MILLDPLAALRDAERGCDHGLLAGGFEQRQQYCFRPVGAANAAPFHVCFRFDLYSSAAVCAIGGGGELRDSFPIDR